MRPRSGAKPAGSRRRPARGYGRPGTDSWHHCCCASIERSTSRLKHLHTHLGQHHLDDITLDVIDTIRVARLKECTKSTCNRYLALVRAILRRERDDWEWLDTVPKVKLYREAEGRERSITPEQAKRLLDELLPHQRDMVLFSLLTGLRQANVLGLVWSC